MGALSLLTTACTPEKPPQFQIVFVATVLSDAGVSSLGSTLAREIPELTIGETPPLFNPLMIMGSQDVFSPMAMGPDVVMGSIMRFSLLVGEGEVDMVISDMENAARFAQDNMFMPLSDIFSDSQLAALEGRLLDFELLGEGFGAEGPERTPPIGVNITEHPGMAPIFGSLEVGVFVVANTRHLDQVRMVLNYLL